MVDRDASVVGEGILTYKAQKSFNQFALQTCVKKTAELKTNKTLLHTSKHAGNTVAFKLKNHKPLNINKFTKISVLESR